MSNKINKIVLIALLCSIMLSFSVSKVLGANTDYIDEDIEEEKGIGLAVIESEGTDEIGLNAPGTEEVSKE